jgi:hypothetical protein
MRGYQRGRLSLNTHWELYRQYAPLIVGYVVLLDGVYSPTSLIASEYINVGVFEHNCRHRASFLVKTCDFFPTIKID